MTNPNELKSIPVWDIPVRLFHWTTVVAVIVLWITAEQGGKWMDVHIWCGYLMLTLLLFRFTWGFFGSRYARFSDFLYSPPQVIRYFLAIRQPSNYIGHNPMGGWSVMMMLLVLSIQASSGLFANDDIFTEGPFAQWVSGETSQWLTTVHKVNFKILLALISLHLSAILFYFVFKGENLIIPMIKGYKRMSVEVSITPFVSHWRAVILLVIAAASVSALIAIA